MSMFCFSDRFTSKAGDALPGYIVRVLDKDSGSVVPIFSDENGSPIETNETAQDAIGNFTVFVNYGIYSVECLDPVTRERIGFRRYVNMEGRGNSKTVVCLDDYGGGPSKAASVNTTALASAIAALPNGGEVHFATPFATYKFSPMALTQDNIRLIGNGITTIRWDVIGATQEGIEVQADGFGADDIIFSGPGSAATYTSGETLIRVRGTTSARLQGMRFKNTAFTGSGSFGLLAEFVDGIQFDNCEATECAYAGWWFRSCDKGRINGGEINVLNAAGVSANAYGMTLTHDSTGYSSDANAGTPLAANPFCNDWVINGLTVIGPKIWQAIDTHGAYNVSVVNCNVFAAGRGISLTTGSGDASQYAGWQNRAIGCICDTRLPDGTQPSGMTIADAFQLRGPTTGTAQGQIVAMGNIARGYGIANSVSSGSFVLSSGVADAVVSGNIVERWSGAGIIIGGANSSGVSVVNNIIGDRVSGGSDTAGSGCCIALNTNMGANVSISGNIHNPASGFEARYGIGGSGFNPSTPTVHVGPNPGFERATVGVTNTFDYQLHGEGYPGAIQMSGSTGSITVDVGAGRLAPGVPLKVRFQSLTGNVTVTNFTNSVRNQNIIVENIDATYTVTITRANAVLPGAVNAVLGQYDTIGLTKSATLWTGTSPVNANG